MFRRIAPHYADRDLAAHPHRLVLSGQPGEMVFPPLCPNCGGAATQQVRLDKVFERSGSDTPTRYEHTWVLLPMCSACAALHQAAVRPPTLARRVASSFATFDMVGAVVLIVAALFCGWLALRDVVKGRLLSGGLLLGLAGVLMLFARAQRRMAWDATAHLRVPQPSEAARAFDFSDDLSQMFEKPRFAVTMKNAAFALAFESLNATRLYRPESVVAVREAQRAQRKTWWVLAAVIAIGLLLDWLVN